MTSASKPLRLHPLLVAAYPALFLFFQNSQDVPWQALPLPLAASLGSALLMNFSLRRLSGNADKAALITSLGLLVLLCSGHVYGWVKDYELQGLRPGRAMVLGPLIGLAFLAAARGIWRSASPLAAAHAPLNLAASLLLGLCFAHWASSLWE